MYLLRLPLPLRLLNCATWPPLPLQFLGQVATAAAVVLVHTPASVAAAAAAATAADAVLARGPVTARSLAAAAVVIALLHSPATAASAIPLARSPAATAAAVALIRDPAAAAAAPLSRPRCRCDRSRRRSSHSLPRCRCDRSRRRCCRSVLRAPAAVAAVARFRRGHADAVSLMSAVLLPLRSLCPTLCAPAATPRYLPYRSAHL